MSPNENVYSDIWLNFSHTFLDGCSPEAPEETTRPEN
jgi:hypothetical protein